MKKLYLFIILFLLFFTKLSGNNIVTLRDAQNEYRLFSTIDIIEDKKHQWKIEDISSSAFADKFIPIDKADYQKGSSFSYWVRFQVKNNSSNEHYWLLESWQWNIDEVEFYTYVDGKGFIQQQTGTSFPFSKRLFEHKNFEFKLPVDSGEVKTFYLKVRSSSANTILLVIRSYQHFISYALKEYYLFGIFYGLLATMLLFNLFHFIIIREKPYLYYVFYVLSFGIYQMCCDGTAFQYLWPNHPEWNLNYAFAFPLFSMVIWALMYAKDFLLTKIYNPLIYKLLLITIGLRTIAFIMGFFNKDYFYEPLFDIVPFFMIYVAGLVSYSKGFVPARYFLWAFTLFFIAFFIRILMNYEIIPSNVFTVYSLNLGYLGEMIALSFALADRMKILKQDKEEIQQRVIEELKRNELQLKENELLKDKVNSELEQKVKERTEDLEIANEQLSMQALEIERMNSLLKDDNVKLTHNVKDLSKARIMQKPVSFEEFEVIYPDEKACFEYISNLKWKKGYKCRKCYNSKFIEGKALYSRRCTKCGYDESVTVHTIFEKLKFPVVKAFYMTFLINSKKEITIDELSLLLSLTKQTCWSYKRKIIDAILIRKSNKKYKKGINSWDQVILLEKNQDNPTET
ncbi:MAG: receptor [Bacteroidetes bacterium]|nr:receptor [Bacteroidota bacterium]